MLRFRLALITVSFILIFHCNSCKKPSVSELFVYGVITNEQTDILEAGVEVNLKIRSLNSGTFNNNYQTLETSLTDSNGAFEFSFENLNISSIQLTFEKENYFYEELEFIPEDVDLEAGKFVSVQMNQIAQVNMSVINSSPINSDDVIEFRYTNAQFDCACCNNQSNLFEGEDVDTTLTCIAPANYTLRYLGLISKGGVTSVDTGSFQITPGINDLQVLY